MAQIMRIIECSLDANGPEILAILNDAILHSTALYDYTPRPPESMPKWFEAKAAESYPVLGAVDDDSRLLGFATYGQFRAWPAYKYSLEHSVYVHRDHRGAGVGSTLMRRLIETARSRNAHLMIGAIDKDNQRSVALHQKLGFRHAGTIAEAGFKFGRWLDLAFYQLVLDTPEHPVDG